MDKKLLIFKLYLKKAKNALRLWRRNLIRMSLFKMH